MSERLEAFLSEWTTAERIGDVEKLATILTEDFYGVGPLGFVLPRAAWLDRHRQGLVYESFGLDDLQIHHFGGVGLVTARNNTRGTYHGQPLPEALRATLLIPTNSATTALAAIHMSFIAGTPGSPPLPVAANPTEER